MVKKKNISIKEMMSLSPLFLELSTIMVAFLIKLKRRSKQLLKNMVILLILPPKAYGHQNQKQSD